MKDEELAEISWYVLRGKMVGCYKYVIKVPIAEIEKLQVLQQYFGKQHVIVDGGIERIVVLCE